MRKSNLTFEIDESGRVICQDHSNYKYLIKPKDYFGEIYAESKATCKTCYFYEDDSCFFSKSKIDEIEFQRLEKKAYRCKLCGNLIDRMFTVIYKIYHKEKFDVDMPLICCNCHENLVKNEFMRDTRNKIIADLFYLSFLIYTIGIFLFLLDIYNIMLVFVSLWLIPWSFFTYRGLKRLKYKILGIQFFRNNFKKSMNGNKKQD